MHFESGLGHKDQAQSKRPTTEQTKKLAHSGPQRELACTSSRRQTWVVDAERCVWCSTTHTTRISHVIHRPTILQFFPKKARSSAHFSAFLSRQVGKYCAKVLRISLLVLTQCQPPPPINPHQSPAGQASSLDARRMRRAVHAACATLCTQRPPLLYSSLAQAVPLLPTPYALLVTPVFGAPKTPKASSSTSSVKKPAFVG